MSRTRAFHAPKSIPAIRSQFRSRFIRLALLAATVSAALTTAASFAVAQVVVLDDGFEPYPLGHFNLRGGWIGHDGLGPGCSIVSSPVRTGSRALEVTMLLGPNPNDQGAPHARWYLPCPSASGSLELDVMKGTNTEQYLDVLLREGSFPAPPAAQLFSLTFPWFGEVRYQGADYPFTPLPTPVFYNGGQWYHVRIDWHPGSTADVWIDGLLKGAGLPFHSPMTSGVQWIELAISASGKGSETGWFDNVRLTQDDYCATPVIGGTWGRLKSIYR